MCIQRPHEIVSSPMAIDVDTPRIDIGCSLENEFNKLIHMNH